MLSLLPKQSTAAKGQDISSAAYSSVFDQNLLKGSVAPLWAAFPHRYYFPATPKYITPTLRIISRTRDGERWAPFVCDIRRGQSL